MVSYISFINNTSYPVISVYSDDNLITDTLLRNSESDKFPIKSGTVDLLLKENRNKPFQKLWVSLYPDSTYTLIIKNTYSFFVK